jgi:signal transduction histidine kinase
MRGFALVPGRRERMSDIDSADDARLRVVLDDLQLGVAIHGPNGELRMANRAALELLQLTEAELRVGVAPDSERAVVREDGSAFTLDTQPLAVAMATGRPVHNIVMGVCKPRHRRHTPHTTWLLASADPQLDGAGDITRIVSTYNDITDRRAFEARLAVSDRLAAMGTLTSGIAHEINNPLAYILANIAYADDELADPESLRSASRIAEIRHAILEARDGAHRVRDIVAEMRTLARGEASQTAIDVRRVLESAASAVASEIRTRATLVLNLVDVPSVNCDEARLGQVVVNLLLNAADAITTGAPAENEIVLSALTDNEGRVVISVRDSGIGIPADLHQRIFDPFFTNKPVGRGRGLGLSICHHIVTDVGGTIGVESAPERGSVFRVTLPPATGPTTRAADLSGS